MPYVIYTQKSHTASSAIFYLLEVEFLNLDLTQGEEN